MMKSFVVLLAFAAIVNAFGPNCEYRRPVSSEIHANNNDMPPNFKVAFIGDQALGNAPVQVLNDILDWGANMVLHQGDFDYEDDPDAWDEQINDVLGPNFPYFAALGNHDILAQNGYQVKLNQRLARIAGATCSGDLGLSSVCSYQGMVFTLNGMGLAGEGHEEYVDEVFSDFADIKWKVCSWHNNHNLYQVGDKPTSVSLEMYETCLRHGAIVATGHEHSYGRTHLMSSFADFEIASRTSPLVMEEGLSFAFCQGLGGRDIRDYSGNEDDAWWASTAAGEDDVWYGALKCTFNVNGNLSLANCFFDDTRGQSWDEFSIVNNAGTNSSKFGGIPKAKCGPHQVQSQVSKACNDVEDAPYAIINDKLSFAMRFKMDVAKGEIIDEAYVEMMGLKELTNTLTTDHVVRISLSPAAASLNKMQMEMCDHGYVSTSSDEDSVYQAVWDMSLTEFAEPIWKTSNLSAKLQHIVDNTPNWKRGDEIVIQFNIIGHQGRSVGFINANESPCHAPTLSVFIKNHCY